ncbi:putative transposase, partial [Caldanaerobius fijiensis DSM 17918]
MKLKKINPDFKQRVIQFELNPDKKQSIILNSLTYASSKLWNVANYEIRNWDKGSGQKYPDWYDQKSRLKN